MKKDWEMTAKRHPCNRAFYVLISNNTSYTSTVTLQCSSYAMLIYIYSYVCHFYILNYGGGGFPHDYETEFCKISGCNA